MTMNRQISAIMKSGRYSAKLKFSSPLSSIYRWSTSIIKPHSTWANLYGCRQIVKTTKLLKKPCHSPTLNFIHQASSNWFTKVQTKKSLELGSLISFAGFRWLMLKGFSPRTITKISAVIARAICVGVRLMKAKGRQGKQTQKYTRTYRDSTCSF